MLETTIVTEDEVRGLTRGPISIPEFFDGDWKILDLPNGSYAGYYCDPRSQGFFDAPSARHLKGTKAASCHLNIMISAIKQWSQKITKETDILAIILFGSSVRVPKIIKVQRGILWWKRGIDVEEKLYPDDVDVLIITSGLSGPVSKLRRKKGTYQSNDGSCDWTYEMCIMGFDINSLASSEFNELLGDFNHECQIPNNVQKEGVLLAGELNGVRLNSPRKAIWDKAHLSCSVV